MDNGINVNGIEIKSVPVDRSGNPFIDKKNNPYQNKSSEYNPNSASVLPPDFVKTDNGHINSGTKHLAKAQNKTLPPLGIEARLERVKKLLDDGLILKEEAAAKRKSILEEL